MRILYFAYGANMATARIQDRVPSAHLVTTAELHGYCLVCNKPGADGSAKCHIVVSDDPTASVHGVLYDVDASERHLLDDDQGLGSLDGIRAVQVTCADGHVRDAFTYYSLHTDDSLQIYDWYKTLLVEGAREHGLPASYRQQLETLPTMPDPDPQRAAAQQPWYPSEH